MNAVEFVSKFGWEKSKQIINDFDKDATADCCFDTGLVNGLEKSWWDVCVYDLKSLVESWEVIKTLGSLKSAKANLSEMYSDSSCDWVHENARLYDYKHLTVGRVNQAIRDVESVGGGV